MKITFEDKTISSEIKKTVKDIIENCPNGAMHKGIIVQYIPYDELDDYDDSEDFINRHKNNKDIYIVYQVVAGAWNQPLTMIAVS